jgi:endo-1,4-beta-xylanase
VYLTFKQLKVPAELHIYAGSGHGFGLRANDPKPAGKWIERFEEWLADGGFSKSPDQSYSKPSPNSGVGRAPRFT